MTQKNPWIFDVRVRERNVKAGLATDKDFEKHIAQLPDLADQVEPFGTSQPALSDSQSVDDDDDDDSVDDVDADGASEESA